MVRGEFIASGLMVDDHRPLKVRKSCRCAAPHVFVCLCTRVAEIAALHGAQHDVPQASTTRRATAVLVHRHPAVHGFTRHRGDPR